MQDHERNGWLVLGGVSIAGGGAAMTSWAISIQTASTPNHLHFWTFWTYLSAGAIVLGVYVVVAAMFDWPLPNRNSDGKISLRQQSKSPSLPPESQLSRLFEAEDGIELERMTPISYLTWELTSNKRRM